MYKNNTINNRRIATPLNYNTFSPETQNNSLNSTVIHNENINGTRTLTQQDIQSPSLFINEEVVHTTVKTTQQSISPIHPNLTTPKNNKATSPQITLQSTVKPSATLLLNIHIWIIEHLDQLQDHQNQERHSQEVILQNTIIVIHIRQRQTTPHEKLIRIMYVLTIGTNQ